MTPLGYGSEAQPGIYGNIHKKIFGGCGGAMENALKLPYYRKNGRQYDGEEQANADVPSCRFFAVR